MGRVTGRHRVTRVRADGTRTARADLLAVEEPLEIRQGPDVLTVTMRTPGNDFDLVAGWLVSEGLLTRTEDLLRASYCPGLDSDGRQTYNVVGVTLTSPVPADRLRRTITSSACGVCGTSSLEAVRVESPYDLASDDVRVDAGVLAGMPVRLRSAQTVFDRTGGLHAAGVFTSSGELLCCREDVGRHNAVDKVVGWALREGLLPLRGHILQVSGRASFELVQKAALAGIPVLSAVSAPSSLAAELASDLGMTLAGFARADAFNVYAGPERVRTPAGR